MTQESQTTTTGWTKEESKQIHAVVVGLARTLVHNKIDAPIAVSALMIMSATTAAASNNTDEEIIENFKKCLFDARTRKDLPNA